MIMRGVPNFFRAFFYSLMFRHNGVMRRASAYLLRCIGDSIGTNCFLLIFQEYNVWTIDIYHFTHLVSAAWTWSQTGKRVRTFCCHFEYIIRNFNRHIIIIPSSLFLFHDQPMNNPAASRGVSKGTCAPRGGELDPNLSHSASPRG